MKTSTKITKKRFFSEMVRQRRVIRTITTASGQYKENREEWVEKEKSRLIEQGYSERSIRLEGDLLHYGGTFDALNNYSKYPEELPVTLTTYGTLIVGTMKTRQKDYKPLNENSIQAEYTWGTVVLTLLY